MWLSAHPETSTDVKLRKAVHGIPPLVAEVVVGHEHLEGGIKCENALKILLAPEEIHRHPTVGNQKEKDIVDVHNDSGFRRGNTSEKDE
jgi:hypothetical protein